MLWTGEENNGSTTNSDVTRISKDEYIESLVDNFEMGVGKLKNDSKPLLDEQPEENTKSIVLRLVEFNRPEWFFMYNGVLASLGFVVTQLVFAISLGTSLGFVGREDIQEAMDGITHIALVKVGLGIVTGVASFGQSAMFAISGEGLVLRLRQQAFEAMLRQEIGWFDSPDNSTGALSARLAETSKVKSAMGAGLGTLTGAIFNIVGSFAIAFVFSWKLGVLVIGMFSLTLTVFYFEGRISSNIAAVQTSALEASAKLATEAIRNIRSVAGLRAEKTFLDRYICLLYTSPSPRAS